MKFFFRKKDRNSGVITASESALVRRGAELDAHIPQLPAPPLQVVPFSASATSFISGSVSRAVSPSRSLSHMQLATETPSNVNPRDQSQRSGFNETSAPNISGTTTPTPRPIPPHAFALKTQVPPGVKIMKGPPPPGMIKKMLVRGVSPPMLSKGPIPPHVQHAGLVKIPHGGGGLIASPLLPTQEPMRKLSDFQIQRQQPQQMSTSLVSPPRSLSPMKGNPGVPPVTSIQDTQKSPSPKQGSTNENRLQLANDLVAKTDKEYLSKPDGPCSVDGDDSDIQFVVETERSGSTTPEFKVEAQDGIIPFSKAHSSRRNSVVEHEKKEIPLSPGNKKVEANTMQKRSGSRSSSIGLGSAGEPKDSVMCEDKKFANNNGEDSCKKLPQYRKEEVLSSSSVGPTPNPPPETPMNRKSVDSANSFSISPRVLEFTERGKGDGNSLKQKEVVENQRSSSAIKETTEPMFLSGARSRIAEQFLSILCPQQFYGRVVKLHSIRLMKTDPNWATGIREYNTIFVVTKGVLPNQYFYPLLRLNESDGLAVSGDNAHGYLDTPVVFCEAAPGNMLFAETELGAKHVFEMNETSTSCFILEKSAIVFRDPLKYVLPKAMLTVRWIPFSAPHSEPQCPVHHKELQLFDHYSKGLLCALCVSRKGGNPSDFVIVPDLCNGDSRHQIMEKLAQKLHQGNQASAGWVKHHQRIVSIAQHKKDAINQHFDLLLAAIKSKREEFLEHCDSAFGTVLNTVAKEVLMMDEKVCMLKAAIDHLRTEFTKPLYSMQVATVANALNACGEFPENLSLESFNISSLTAELTPNLEGVMTELQSVSPGPRSGTTQHERIRSSFGDAGLNDNYHKKQKRSEEERDTALRKISLPRSTWDERDIEETNSFQQQSPKHVSRTLRHPVGSSRSLKRRSKPLVPVEMNNRVYAVDKGIGLDQHEGNGEWIALPGCHGTCIFDLPLDELLINTDDVKNTHAKPKCLQWTLRVDDPGDWVGIGVGVGSNPKTWTASRTPDLSHLWVVTNSDTRHVFILRVTVNMSLGHAKLSIHDGRGKRIDDNRIPQWNAARTCHPQVTFGGRIGEVHLIETPHLLSK